MLINLLQSIAIFREVNLPKDLSENSIDDLFDIPDRPADVFRGSIVTPPLLVAIITGKYLDNLPHATAVLTTA